MARTYDLTCGKVSKLILAFFFPMLFTSLLQQAYTIADTIIVGKGLGDEALAAVGNMGPLTFLIMGFTMGLTNGFSVSIAHKYGSKDFEGLRKAIACAIKLSVFIAVFVTIISVVALKSILILLNTSDDIIKDSLIYGYIIFGGLFSTIAYNLCSAILRALGDSKTPLMAIIASSIINVALNCITVFAMNTGVEGPAVATIASQIVSTLICLARLKQIDIIALSKKDFEQDFSMYGLLLKNGIAMAIMNSVTAVGSMVVQYFVNTLGLVYTSAYSACMRILNLFMDPSCTAGFTMSSFASQNFGAKKYDRIKEGLKVCLSISFVSYITLGSLMIFIPKVLARTMLNGADSIQVCGEFLPICGIFIIFLNCLFVFRSGVQGMGYPLFPMLSGILEMIMRISVIILFTDALGFKATAFASVAAWLGALLLNGSAFIVILQKKLREQKKQDYIEIDESFLL